MPIKHVLIPLAFGALCLMPQSGRAETPLSAIDWLSQSLATPPVAPKPAQPAVAAGGALPQEVSVSVLGGPSPDASGLLAPSVTGFPRAVWGMGRSADIAAAIQDTRTDALPALQGLLLTLLLAEADAPSDARADGALLTARVDKLLEIGALEQASALLSAAGPITSVDLFRRSFDVALLTGDEDRACATLRATPGLAPTLTARVFCLARAGDWNAAALTLNTSQALQQVSAEESALLSRFLDPELAEVDLPPPPTPITPLTLRIYEAIGAPLSTATLPPAFAHADLSTQTGWKSQIEAAERLVRAGAIAPNLLLGLYTERPAAASGGVWDRVDAFQRFDASLAKGDLAGIAQHLPLAYGQMAAMELEVPFATLFAKPLNALPLQNGAGALAFEIGLLSPDYEIFATSARIDPANTRALFLAGLAKGNVKGLTAPDSMARAIAPAFLAPALSEIYAPLLDQRRLGEAILQAMAQISNGLQGNIDDVTAGLALLRHVGLEDVARRTALELMLLERRG